MPRTAPFDEAQAVGTATAECAKTRLQRGTCSSGHRRMSSGCCTFAVHPPCPRASSARPLGMNCARPAHHPCSRDLSCTPPQSQRPSRDVLTVRDRRVAVYLGRGTALTASVFVATHTVVGTNTRPPRQTSAVQIASSRSRFGVCTRYSARHRPDPPFRGTTPRSRPLATGKTVPPRELRPPRCRTRSWGPVAAVRKARRDGEAV